MSNHLWLKLGFGLALMTMAACSSNDNDDDDDDDDGPIQSQFGETFEGAFNLEADEDPIDPKPGDLPAVTLTEDPIDF